MSRWRWALLAACCVLLVVATFLVVGWKLGLISGLISGSLLAAHGIRCRTVPGPPPDRHLQELARIEELARARTETAETVAMDAAKEIERDAKDTATGMDRPAAARRLRNLFFGSSSGDPHA